jgi:hypothetical protein
MAYMNELLQTEHRPTNPRARSTSQLRRRMTGQKIEDVLLEIKVLVYERSRAARPAGGKQG